jgi:hypothetical protein
VLTIPWQHAHVRVTLKICQVLAKAFRQMADINKPHDRKKDTSSTTFEKDGCYTKFGDRCLNVSKEFAGEIKYYSYFS